MKKRETLSDAKKRELNETEAGASLTAEDAALAAEKTRRTQDGMLDAEQNAKTDENEAGASRAGDWDAACD